MTKIAPDPSFTLSSLPPEISTKLQRQVEGEVLVDGASRGRYATDASIYQQFPVAVLVPKSAQDIEVALEVANPVFLFYPAAAAPVNAARPRVPHS
jgi:hypothetical protein